MATVTGQRSSSTLPLADTPRDAGTFPAHGDPADSAQSARSAWRSVTPSIAGTPHVRLSRDGGKSYPARHARPLPADPPGLPCTVPVYDAGSGSGKLLAIDLDPGRGRRDVHGAPGQQDHERRPDPAAQVRVQAEALVGLVSRCGGQALADIAPSGGQHVYVMFGEALPWRELRDLCRAIAVRFPAVDPAPMAGLGGQISPPGGRHKSGGWRLLSVPAVDALAAVEHPNGPEVWVALLTEFAAELQQVEIPIRIGIPGPAAAELDDAGVPWVPRLGGRANLSPELDLVARTGRWNRTRHPGRSEARMAVLAAAAARGWQLADVRAALVSGAWRGFPELYYRASEPGRIERLLPLEWRKSVAFVAGEENVRHWLTSDRTHAPPAPIDGADSFGLIRQWVTGTGCAAADPERVRGWGRCAVAVRQLLAAIGQAAMVSGSTGPVGKVATTWRHLRRFRRSRGAARHAALEAAKPELPGSKHAALADFLRRNTLGGALLRRLHPAGAAG